MARVTVEDCLKNVRNRFELVIVAAKRARQLMRGKEPRVDWDNDKSTVVALREIAAGLTNVQNINLPETHHPVEIVAVETEIIEIEPTATDTTTDDEALDQSSLDDTQNNQ